MFFIQKSKFIVISFVLLMILVPNIAFAQFQLIPNCALGTYNAQRGIYEQKTAPDLNCVEQILVNVAQIILGLSGAIALLMFIYGGFLWLTAAGSSSKVQQGTKIMVGTVIGLVIIFGANLAITTVRNVLLDQGLGTSQSQTQPASSGGTPSSSATCTNGGACSGSADCPGGYCMGSAGCSGCP